MKLICILLLVTCIVSIGDARDYCINNYGGYVKKYSTRYFGVDFPYWYSIGVLKTESNCVWIRSKDGHGSVGVAQITPKWWDEELVKAGYGKYATDPATHIGAFKYMLFQVYKNVIDICKTPADTKKLWITYQGYNRSIGKLNREVQQASVCSYDLWRFLCKERDVCVWRLSDGSCGQWRNGCDINSSYSRKIYDYGSQYKRFLGVDSFETRYIFW